MDLPTEKPLTILFQDEWLIAVDKPAGQMVTPPDTPGGHDAVTMKILRDQISQRVYPIHRLDRPTTGVLLFALQRDCARSLHKIFEQHEITKTYWAVINGQPEKEVWTCDLALKKDSTSPEQTAQTKFRLIERLPKNLSLVEAIPETGRFHQIRRHLLHAGHPIIGDYRYAGIDFCDSLGAELDIGTRMLLQARSLEFQHPMSSETLLIETEVDPMIQKIRPSIDPENFS